MTRKQTKAALLASVKATADDNHFDGVSTGDVLRFLGHETARHARGQRILYAGHTTRRWEARPRLAHDLNDLVRFMKEHHGCEVFSLDRYRGDYRVQVCGTLNARPHLPGPKLIHPDMIHAILGAFLAAVD